MEEDNKIKLSIIVICHNQKNELRRCLDSIISMNLSFPHEIIVSDDRSSDGTREMLENKYKKKVVITYCNSDTANLNDNSARSGYNRCNAYQYARGKYLVHVDADDFFCPNAVVYEKQVLALENHPECSMAMSGCLNVKDYGDGINLSSATPYKFPRKMIENEVLSHEQYFQYDFFHINQCYMQRRNTVVDPVALYGCAYVDSVITFHHLQFGKIIYVDANDYIYVSHNDSIVDRIVKNDNKDTIVLWCIGIYVSWFIPYWFKYFIKGYSYQHILNVIRLARSGYKLSNENFSRVSSAHIYIYDVFHRKLSVYDKVRLWLLDFYIRFIKVTDFINSFSLKILKFLMYK